MGGGDGGKNGDACHFAYLLVSSSEWDISCRVDLVWKQAMVLWFSDLTGQRGPGEDTQYIYEYLIMNHVSFNPSYQGYRS